VDKLSEPLKIPTSISGAIAAEKVHEGSVGLAFYLFLFISFFSFFPFLFSSYLILSNKKNKNIFSSYPMDSTTHEQ
jgi:hypothetical protein